MRELCLVLTACGTVILGHAELTDSIQANGKIGLRTSRRKEAMSNHYRLLQPYSSAEYISTSVDRTPLKPGEPAVDDKNSDESRKEERSQYIEPATRALEKALKISGTLLPDQVAAEFAKISKSTFDRLRLNKDRDLKDIIWEWTNLNRENEHTLSGCNYRELELAILMKHYEPEDLAAGLIRLYNVDGQETIASELLRMLLSYCKQEDASKVMHDVWREWNLSPGRLFEVLDLGKPGVLEGSVEAAWQFFRYTQWRYSLLNREEKRYYEWTTAYTAKQLFHNQPVPAVEAFMTRAEEMPWMVEFGMLMKEVELAGVERKIRQ